MNGDLRDFRGKVTPETYQRATCAKKIRHRTRAKAIRAASVCASVQPGLHLHAYRCPVCAGWHLTHQERRPHG